MLSALSQNFDQLANELLVAVRDGDEVEISRLDAQILPLTRRIFDFEARDHAEVMAQIAFFNRLAMKNCEDDGSVRHYTTLMSSLFARYLERNGVRRPLVSSRDQAPSFVGYDPSLHELVLDSIPERVAVFDLDYRYIYCNQRNAEFHNKRPSDFIGKHLLDMIDRKRFKSRAKPRIDECIGGARVSYSYEAADAHGRLFAIKCRMTPLTGPDDAIAGAVLVLSMQPMFARTA